MFPDIHTPNACLDGNKPGASYVSLEMTGGTSSFFSISSIDAFSCSRHSSTVVVPSPAVLNWRTFLFFRLEWVDFSPRQRIDDNTLLSQLERHTADFVVAADDVKWMRCVVAETANVAIMEINALECYAEARVLTSKQLLGNHAMSTSVWIMMVSKTHDDSCSSCS